MDFQRLKNWMFEDALPFWGTAGMDKANGGYVEHFDLDARPVDPGFKRVRVIGRQIYVFSHAAMLGWSQGRACADAGVEFLLRHGWQGPDAGWARRLSANGEVLDPTPDLYDIAFVLFALGWHSRLTGDSSLRGHAERTLDFLDAHMRHPAGGFLHEKPATGHRQQNPHMHLLEALLVWCKLPDAGRFEALAREIVGLFQSRFFDATTRTLAEFFNEQLQRADGDAGRIIEPGHQLEWAWILADARQLLGLDTAATAEGLIGFAEEFGVDPVSGVTYNQVRDDGVPLDTGSRSWPNTERMKAAVAAFELFGRDPRPVLAQSSNALFQRYLTGPVPGTWIDAFDGAGQPTVDKIPTSTLYHVFLAFAETVRIEEAVRQRFG
jgi:N-acylglucosamine 2-epimerase/mannose-6-phosphate isomerase